MINHCEASIRVADSLNGRNPCTNDVARLSEALDVAECCRIGGRFDLAEWLVGCVMSFSRGKSGSIGRRAKSQLTLIKQRSSEAEKHRRDEEPPPLIIQTWNFTSAMIRWAGAGCPTRSQKEISKLLKICQKCPFLVEKHCTKCGCQCNEKEQVMNKLAIKTEHCPIGKW